MAAMAVFQDGAGLQTARDPMLTAEGPISAESFHESPVQPLEATSGYASSIMPGPEEQQVPTEDEPAFVNAEPRQEGLSSLEARQLYVQQGIDRLVSCQNWKGSCIHQQSWQG